MRPGGFLLDRRQDQGKQANRLNSIVITLRGDVPFFFFFLSSLDMYTHSILEYSFIVEVIIVRCGYLWRRVSKQTILCVIVCVCVSTKGVCV